MDITANDEHYPDSLLFISAGFLPRVSVAAAELILLMTTKSLRRRPDRTLFMLPPDVGRRTSESRPCYKVSLSRVCSQRHQSMSELSMQQMFWMGARKMFRTLKCSSVSEKLVIGNAAPVRHHHQQLHHLLHLTIIQ